jgi:hypothetical protein
VAAYWAATPRGGRGGLGSSPPLPATSRVVLRPPLDLARGGAQPPHELRLAQKPLQPRSRGGWPEDHPLPPQATPKGMAAK